MGSIDRNLRSGAGVEKERRCGIPLTASERWSKGQLWLIDESPNEQLSGAEIQPFLDVQSRMGNEALGPPALETS